MVTSDTELQTLIGSIVGGAEFGLHILLYWGPILLPFQFQGWTPNHASTVYGTTFRKFGM